MNKIIYEAVQFSNREQRKKITSRKVTAPFLVGSVILETWNIHIRDLIFQEEWVAYQSYNNKHYCWGIRITSLDTSSGKDSFVSKHITAKKFFRNLAAIAQTCGSMTSSPLVNLACLWSPSVPLQHLKAAQRLFWFLSCHRSPVLIFQWKAWLLGFMNTGF